MHEKQLVRCTLKLLINHYLERLNSTLPVFRAQVIHN